MSKNLYNKILIVKLAGIGDVLQTTPLLHALKRNFPQAKVTWLSSPWPQDAIKNHPAIDEVIIYDPPLHSAAGFYGNMLNTLQALARVRSGKYELAFIPHRTPFAAWLCKLAGVTSRVGFRGDGYSPLTKAVEYDALKPEIERNLDLLRALGIDVDEEDKFPKIYLRNQDRKFIDDLLIQFGLRDGERFVVMAPAGAKNPGVELKIKCWNPDGYARVADELIEKFGLKIVLAGDANDADEVKRVSELMKSQPVNLAGRTEILHLAALIQKADLFIGNDSGPLYIAAAVGTPTVSVFGPTDPNLLAPAGKSHRSVSVKVDCGPCFTPLCVYEHSLTCDNVKCMDEIEPAQVLEAAVDLLRQAK